MYKIQYEEPTCKLLVIRFEQGILTGSDFAKGGIRNITVNDVTDDSDGWGA